MREADGAARWEAAGRPTVPSLVVGGKATPILHVSQLASLLGVPMPPQLGAPRLAWDICSVLEAWVELIRPLDWELLTAPTPSRERSLRNLTVNTFHPIELLPEAFVAGRFEWDPSLDGDREAVLRDPAAVVAYASERHVAWREWLDGHEAELAARDPAVESPRGPISYANLLASQRWHAAFHYRQLLAFLDGRGHDVTGALALSSLRALDLPVEVF